MVGHILKHSTSEHTHDQNTVLGNILNDLQIDRYFINLREIHISSGSKMDKQGHESLSKILKV